MSEELEIREFDPEWLVRRGIYLTFITPEVAADLLLRNTNNRKLKKAAVERYKQEMLAGRWDIDASDIKVSRSGELIDGQNRLTACTQAGVGFPTTLRTGLSLATKRRVDIGVKRTVGDAFTQEGVHEATNTAAAINLRIRYEDAEARGLKLDSSPGVRKTQTISPDAALEYLRTHPEHEKTTTMASRMHKAGPGIGKSVWFAFMGMAAHADEKDAFRFAEEFVGGDFPPGSPLMALYRHLAAIAARPRMGKLIQERNASDKALTALITVWNAWRMDEPLDRVVVRDTDPMIPVV